jgi:hypothetical protein
MISRCIQWLCGSAGSSGVFTILVLLNALLTHRVVQQAREIRDADEVHQLQWAVIQAAHDRTRKRQETR